MALLSPLYLQAATGDTAIAYSGQQFRALVGAMATYPGVMLAGDLRVAQRAAGANLSVDVAAGTVFIQGGSIAYQGSYFCQSTSSINMALSAADPTNPRVDLIVAQLYDKQSDGGTQYSWTPLVVTGTPAATPAPPAAPVSSVVLARVAVAAGAASVTNANITDVRLFATGFSSTAIAANYAALPTTPRQGDMAFEQDTKIHVVYDGSVWQRFTPVYAGYFYGTTDANGYLTIPYPSNLGFTPSSTTTVLASIIGVAGGTAIPSQIVINNAAMTAASFQVRVFVTTGAVYAGNLTISYLIRR